MHIKYKGASIFFTDQGTGPTAILLHGFLENKEMWTTMTPILTKTHRVVCIDLLGHGKSDSLGYVHTMDHFAAAVLEVINYLKLSEVTIIGHSMGGYVGLAFAKVYPEKIQALCLLNSTPETDSEERKKLRSRANNMAKTGYQQLVRMSVANLFDPVLKERFNREIETAINEALKTPVQGYIAANTGMSERPDSVHFWRISGLKKGIILGKNDWIVDSKKHVKLLSNHSDLCAQLDGGHMLHITNLDATLKEILRFLKM